MGAYARGVLIQFFLVFGDIPIEILIPIHYFFDATNTSNIGFFVQ